MPYKITQIDPTLTPYTDAIAQRMEHYKHKKKDLLGTRGSLCDFANGHKFFGFHRTEDGWVYREWAPAAEAMYLTGDFNHWDIYTCPMTPVGNGIFEVYLSGPDALVPKQKVQAIVIHDGQILRRIPLYATKVMQDPDTYLWCAELEDPKETFPWTDQHFKPARHPLIYECHIGMAGEDYRVHSYQEFRDNILPRIHSLGYNTIQIMAVMEHPYYGSFGYQVSNFFAASSRYGSADDLRSLIDTAHGMGIAVLLDIVHSHAVSNTSEGINEFDGTVYQFFHEGEKGNHSAWGTKLFHYGKNEVLHFLLSNLKYWMEAFHFDGFRFDGVTSMLYLDHGLGSHFSGYEMYFSDNTDLEAVTYLQLANELIHKLNPSAVTIAEDMSGMPGMCLPVRYGGIGFDYRLAMGIPDMWIKMIADYRDEYWDMYRIWHTLTDSRLQEKTISYAESHDQALVGDKTLIFRLCDAAMYSHMSKFTPSLSIDRGIALHKMIRLITATLAGEGYLNFMGNEFGHPEWIDFPREGNGWSYHYCRRQWSLADNTALRYGGLQAFDQAMLALIQKEHLLSKEAYPLWINQYEQLIIYGKGELVFVFRFSPSKTGDFFIPVKEEGAYRVVLCTDDACFEGPNRIDTSYRYTAVKTGAQTGFKCLLPDRFAMVLKKIRSRKKK